uniref:PEST proteolytic signal-containing nuclear protein n=1 Tax=Caenorhabditis tropicalis TaxID=1561998 RepID=A0A1I7TV12_9PELO
MSYLDESKTVKEFVREFIKRRIAMRAAGGGARPDTDDLTSARTAAAAPSDSNSGSNSNSGNGQGKKKKKTQKQVLDGNILGFRGAAASDRLNKGEIDAIPTTPVNPSRR